MPSAVVTKAEWVSYVSDGGAVSVGDVLTRYKKLKILAGIEPGSVTILFFNGDEAVYEGDTFSDTILKIYKGTATSQTQMMIDWQKGKYDKLILRKIVSMSLNGTYIYSTGGGGVIVNMLRGTAIDYVLSFLPYFNSANSPKGASSAAEASNASPSVEPYAVLSLDNGFLFVENMGTPARLTGVRNQVTLPSGTMVGANAAAARAAVSGLATDTLSADPTPVPITLKPAGGTSVAQRWVNVKLSFPDAATTPILDRSIECRVDGVLTAPRLNDARTEAVLVTDPLPNGSHRIEAALTTAGGVRSTAVSSISVSAPLAAPVQVERFSGVKNIGLKWNMGDEPNVAGFNVFRSADSASQGTLLNPEGPLTQPVFVDVAPPAGQWFYSVRAVTPSGVMGVRSTPVRAALSPANVQGGAPAVVQLAAVSEQTGVRVSFYDGYARFFMWELQRANAEAGPYKDLLGGEHLGASSWLDTTVSAGRTYWYRVKPVGLDGAVGEWVTLGPVIAEDLAPPVPSGLTVSVHDGTARLRWDPCKLPDFKTFRVYRKRGGGAFAQVSTADVTSGSYVDTALSPGIYQWKVTAVDKAGQESAGGAMTGVSWWLPDGPQGAFRFSKSTYNVGSKATSVTVPVLRGSGSSGASFVKYEVYNTGVITDPKTGILAFEDGQTTRNVVIPIHSVPPGPIPNTFNVRLKSPEGGAALGTPKTAQVVVAASGP